MPRDRPATTGYERLAQADQFSDESDDDAVLENSFVSLQPQTGPRYAPITQPRPHSGMATPKASRAKPRPKRPRSNSGIDLKAINSRLERWADEIASKFKRGPKNKPEERQLEIHHSVFQAPEGVRPATAEELANAPSPAMSKEEFDNVVEGVRVAINQGLHPRMITKGSSGSYFARNAEGKVVGVFKPKDEEPYAAGNPKWNKWIHRNLFPCCFGRACLIPNLSYVSEAAAYTLDCQLQTHMVPHTEVVHLSSKSFHYPYWDRRNFYRKRKPFPEKPGSFQVFLKGYKDATIFLRENPWPIQHWSAFYSQDTQNHTNNRWTDSCAPSSQHTSRTARSDDGEESEETLTPNPERFIWTEVMKQSFREELEKLVILDYIMRNTDRGLDNWMIKVDWEAQAVSMVTEHPQMQMEVFEEELAPRPVDLSQRPEPETSSSAPYHGQQPMKVSNASKAQGPKVSIGAIDNSLSWPWKHPDAWRSFPFGWLFLPVGLIGQPFSQKTRDHFLPLLTSSQWWSQTQSELRKVFQIDPDFQEKMFLKQMAVMKGQAWNVVETLKTPDHGPLELTRRAKVCVWDDVVDVPVTVPMHMRAPSAEVRRKAVPRARDIDEEEADIAAAHASSVPTQLEDLLGSGSHLPDPARFDLSSPRAESPGRHEVTSPRSPDGRASQHADAGNSPDLRPTITRMAPRSSYQGPSRPGGPFTARGERRFSFTPFGGRRDSYTLAQQLYGYDEDEDDGTGGDLGFAAAQGMERNKRKVIVERLETVKAKNPVFTWC